jgi:hypothetical protein
MTDHGEQSKAATRCAEIIKFMPINGMKYPNQQHARAEPNQRLKEVFGSDNGFTNPDSGVKTRFLDKAELLMQKAMKMDGWQDIDDWTDLRRQAMAYFSEYMDRAGPTAIKLAELTQYIVLKQSLCYLFEDADEALKTSDTQFLDITYIARRINELWIASKTGKDLTENERPVWTKETELHKAIHRVTVPAPVSGPEVTTLSLYDLLKHLISRFSVSRSPEAVAPSVDPSIDPKTPELNPMNLLLPAYETMWRVVMRCFLEVQHQDAPGGPN